MKTIDYTSNEPKAKNHHYQFIACMQNAKQDHTELFTCPVCKKQAWLSTNEIKGQRCGCKACGFQIIV